MLLRAFAFAHRRRRCAAFRTFHVLVCAIRSRTAAWQMFPATDSSRAKTERTAKQHQNGIARARLALFFTAQ
eukprot:6407631-Lingulodinium_polyedra.AAC.1